MNLETKAYVECYSGHIYAQRPLAFEWQGQRKEVAEVETDWQAPEGKCFRVRTMDSQVFELVYLAAEDTWAIKAL
jgi:hypothetical protein